MFASLKMFQALMGEGLLLLLYKKLGDAVFPSFVCFTDFFFVYCITELGVGFILPIFVIDFSRIS